MRLQMPRALSRYVAMLACCAGIVVLGCDSELVAADWPNWRGPSHNGLSDEAGWTTDWPENGPKLLWAASVGTGFCSIAVSDGRAYTMGNINDNDILYCLDADTGSQIWKKSYACPLFSKQHEGGPAATPTVHGDAVYTFSKNGDVIRWDKVTGEMRWHRNIVKELGIKQPTWYFAGSPLVVDNMIILNAGTHGVALNKADGSLVWQNGKGPCGYATPVAFTVGNRKCVAMFASRDLAGVTASTGKVIWTLPWKTSWDINAADPIVSGDTMFISSGYNSGCALLRVGAHDVTAVWRNKNMRNHANSCVLWQGHIYGFDGQFGGGGRLTCIDYDTGERKWTQKGMGTGSLMLADGKLIILGERGKLVIAKASPEKFEHLASAQILTGKCWTVPVLANGRIYARNAQGKLVCHDVRSNN